MRTPLPPALETFRNRLHGMGFEELDTMPGGGRMGSERLLVHQGGLVFDLGADRSFWYVAAGARVPGQDLQHVETVAPAAWSRVLGAKPDERLESRFAETDEDEARQLEQHAAWFLAHLAAMRDLCAPERTAQTALRLRGGSFQGQRV